MGSEKKYVTPEEVDALRERVDSFGRPRLNALLGWNYENLTKLLLKYRPMSEEVYATISGCIEMHTKDAA